MLYLVRLSHLSKMKSFASFSFTFDFFLNSSCTVREKLDGVKTLGARMRLSSSYLVLRQYSSEVVSAPKDADGSEVVQPLVLWEGITSNGEPHRIVVDPMLTRYKTQSYTRMAY